MDRDKIASRVLPPEFLLPLLELCGDVENHTLQELWAQLLASAVADDSNAHPSFVRVLSQFSASDAVVFEEIRRTLDPTRDGAVSLERLSEITQLSARSIELICQNLVRVGVCEDGTTPPYPAPTRGQPLTLICLSVYGVAFARACLGKAKRGAGVATRDS
ncbi:MAG: Abi-alpha family protein [Pirellulales bacterium]